MDNVAGKMIRGSLWMSSARVFANIASFLGMIVLARILAPADFGLFALGTTIFAIVNAVTDISMTQALVHHRNPDDDHFDTAWTLNTIRGTALAAAMSLAAIPVADFYQDHRLAYIIWALAFATFTSGMSNTRLIILTKQLVFWQEFLIVVAQKGVTVIVSIAVALLFESYWALVAGSVIGQIVADIVSYAILPHRPRPTLRHARELYAFSIWLSLDQAINTLNWKFDQLMIGVLLNKTVLGFYSVGENLAQIPSREATQPLTKTVFPAFSRIGDDGARLRQAYLRAQSLVTAVVLPVGGGVTLIAEPLVRLTMGVKWLPSVPVIAALSTIFALSTLGLLVQPLAMAKGETRTLFRRDAALCALQLPSTVAGLYLGGLSGLIAARIATSLIAIVANMLLVRRLVAIGLIAQFRSNRRSLIALAAMMGLVAGVRALYLAALDPFAQIVLSVVLGGTAYTGMTVLLWRRAGMPEGPETEIGHLIAAMTKRLRPVPPAR
jgi:O-antigen/teichoic acid export membrane protein